MKALDIKYRDVDGAKYPELQISKNPEADRIPLGKYGQICLNFIKEEYPDRYAELRMSGDLMCFRTIFPTIYQRLLLRLSQRI